MYAEWNEQEHHQYNKVYAIQNLISRCIILNCIKQAWNSRLRARTLNNSITFYCFCNKGVHAEDGADEKKKIDVFGSDKI